MKKIKTMILFIVIITSLTFPVFAGASPSEWAIPYVKLLNDNPRYNESVLFDDFHAYLTRQEAAYVAVMIYEELSNLYCSEGNAFFEDTNDSYVLKAKNHGLVNGKTYVMFSPTEYVTREEMAVILFNVLKQAGVDYSEMQSTLFEDDLLISSWASESVYIAKANGYMNGVGNNIYNPNGLITKEQTIASIIKLLSVFSNQIAEKNVYQILNLDLNNVVFESDDENYVLTISKTSMVTSVVDGEFDIYFSASDNFDVRLFKYNYDKHYLEPILFELRNSDTEKEFNFNDVSLVSLGSRFSIDMIYNEVDKLKLNFSRYGGYTKYETFDFIDVNPQRIVNSRIIAKSIDGEDAEVFKNYGQYVVKRHDDSIVYQLDGILKPQYVNSSIEDVPAKEFYTIPIDAELLFVEIKFMSSTKTLEDFTMLYKSSEIDLEQGQLMVPMVSHIGYDKFEIKIHTSNGASEYSN